jgi:hypothetical protein
MDCSFQAGQFFRTKPLHTNVFPSFHSSFVYATISHCFTALNSSWGYWFGQVGRS